MFVATTCIARVAVDPAEINDQINSCEIVIFGNITYCDNDGCHDFIIAFDHPFILCEDYFPPGSHCIYGNVTLCDDSS